jgi:ABC-type nitrate/sulfonate/bicarbonate transport system ATPase subunit
MLQNDLLLPSKTILDNVCLPLTVARVSRQERYARATPLFERFGLAGCERLYPHELSGGMRQRAALLRTYLMDNPVVLLDEPFSALDAMTRVELRTWLTGMLSSLGMTALLITHDVDEAIAVGDTIGVLVGRPTAGEPSHLVRTVRVPAAREAREEFCLSQASLALKRDLLSLL